MSKLNVPNMSPTLGWKVASRLHGVDRIHRIQGGLANQMFQYAHAWALQHRHPARSFIDTSRYEVASTDRAYRIEDVFEMPDKLPHLSVRAGRWIKSFGLDRSNRSEESTIEFKESFIENDLRGVVQGFFPSFKYSAAIGPLLRRNFQFKKPVPPRNRALMEELKDGNGVAVHVRRGDYLSPENKSDFYGMCTPAYYRAAARHLKALRPAARLYFFSDDPEWCRQEFTDIAHHVVDGNVGEDAWADMALISLCRDSIIANSSYSLWARWLSGSDDGINIGPARFLNDGAYGAKTDDILPSSFVRMDEHGVALKGEANERSVT